MLFIFSSFLKALSIKLCGTAIEVPMHIYSPSLTHLSVNHLPASELGDFKSNYSKAAMSFSPRAY
jgi:hypothetical protein